MKRFLVSLALLGTMGIMGLITLGLTTLPSSTVLLPIEVIGSENHTESVSVSVSDASDVDRVWLMGYSVAHPQHFVDTEPGRYSEPKAEVRLNGGPWVGVTNENVTCNEPEESAFNCVQGPYHTTRFAISTSRLGTPVDGQNQLEFRFNYASGDLSSGYYVLGVSFLRASEAPPSYDTWEDTGAIDGTTWEFDDPAGWTPPSGFDTQSDIDAGRSLWEQRDRLIDRPGGPPIVAACADCHASNGEDLEYFSFSNKSIVSRSEFHGLSTEEGKQIAAYIRSQSGPRVSWPWQPPYQPGPEITSPDPECQGMHPDEAPQKCWSAGAGLEWVLEEDTETTDYLFPNGAAGNAGLDVASTQSDINLREVPIGLMYPDWNDWLPRTHPLDSDAFGNEFRSSTLWNTYESGSLHDAKSDPGALHSVLSNWYEDRYLFGGQVIDDQQDPLDEKMGYRQWGVVKVWEIMRGVEDYAPQVYENGEARSWLGPDSTPFDVAPHIHEGRVYGSERSLHDTYLDTAWYDIAMLLNAGNRAGEHILFPVDWRYHIGHIKGFSQAARPEPLRFARAYLKQNQMLDLGDTPASESDTGLANWFWRYTTHFQMFDSVAPETDKTPIAFAPEPLKTNLYTTLFRSYMQRVLRVPTEDWRRGYDEADLEPESHVPDPNQNVIGVTDYAEHFYRGIPWLRDRGVRSSLIDSAATWAAIMWPEGNDPNVMGGNPTWDEMNPCIGSDIPADCSGGGGNGNGDPTVILTAPASGTSFIAPATIDVAAEASDSDGSIESVAFSADGQTLATDTEAPYEYTWQDVGAGSYTLTATATDNDGQTETASLSVTVTEPGAPSNGVAYSYYEGEWDALPDFGTLTPEATGTIGTFVVDPGQREDYFGLRYVSYVNIPEGETGTYTFYTQSDDGTRLYVDDALVVDNDGIHAVEEESGTTTLTAGWHKITVEYFEAWGGQDLTVLWESDAIAKTEMPAERLFLSPPQQQLSLRSGWNAISSFVEPDDPALDQVFAETHDLVMVKDGVGNAYIPSLGVNDIGPWQSDEAYQVFVETEQPLDVTGTLIDSDTPIALEPGWNAVPFYPRSEMDVVTAFASISDQLVMVKDGVGNTYIPSMDVNDIGMLEPGKGYQVYVESAVSFAYPVQQTAALRTR